MIFLKEPLWGENLLKNLYYWMLKDQFLVGLIPILADIFVFLYPIYLTLLFLWGTVKKRFYYQSSALFTFFASFFAVFFNIFVQLFVDKARPNIVLGLSDLKTETILHKFLPASSFPSDHAALSTAFASAVFFWGLKNKDKKFIILGVLFYVFSLIMILARVVSGVHRPTDVIAGAFIGIIVAWVLFYTKIFYYFENKINIKLVNVFNKMFRIRN